jgi:hypothetical protein
VVFYSGFNLLEDVFSGLLGVFLDYLLHDGPRDC